MTSAHGLEKDPSLKKRYRRKQVSEPNPSQASVSLEKLAREGLIGQINPCSARGCFMRPLGNRDHSK